VVVVAIDAAASVERLTCFGSKYVYLVGFSEGSKAVVDRGESDGLFLGNEFRVELLGRHETVALIEYFENPETLASCSCFRGLFGGHAKL